MENVNKIPTGATYRKGEQKIRVTITDETTGEVLYSHQSDGGVLCTVERHKVLNETQEVEGNQQHMMWGHPALIVHACTMNNNKITEIIQNDPVFVAAVRSAFVV